MKIAHIAVVTPQRCGLYETARELVAAECQLGADARIVDPQPTPLHPGGDDDRGAPLAEEPFAFEADVVVNHSGMDGRLDAVTAPVIYCSHGRPQSSFNGERTGGTPVYSYYYNRGYDKPRFDAVATFWPEHAPYLRVMFKETPVHALPPTVDCDKWTPDGPSGYDFHGNRADVNIVITDPWRDDINPFWAVNAFILFSRAWQGAKLHLYGLDGNRKGLDPLLKIMQAEGTLGEVCGWTIGLDHVYRAADALVTPHRILTRSIRESMASGCPVVSGGGCVEEAAQQIAEVVLNPPNVRETAMQWRPENAARHMLEIAESLVGAACP